MPTHRAAYNAGMALLTTALEVSRPNVKLTYANIDFDPSEDFDPSTDEGWIRFNWFTADGFLAARQSANNRRFRTPGQLIAQVFVPALKGLELALAIADDVVAACRGVVSGGVIFHTATPRVVGLGHDNTYFQVNVECGFRYDDIG